MLRSKNHLITYYFQSTYTRRLPNNIANYVSHLIEYQNNQKHTYDMFLLRFDDFGSDRISPERRRYRGIWFRFNATLITDDADDTATEYVLTV